MKQCKALLAALILLAPLAHAEGTPDAAALPPPDANLPPPASMDNPAPALDAGSPSATPGSTANTPGATPVPEAQPPTPVATIPGKAEPAPAVPEADQSRSVYDEYGDYRKKTREREEDEHRMKQRNMFAHENGAWQFGVEYIYKAFADYNFNPTIGPGVNRVFGDNSGPGISLTYFPLRSLSFGRLGIGISGGYYWSKFSVTNSPASADLGSNKSVLYSYGARLTYEFDYFLGQLFVPYVFVGYDQVSVDSIHGQINGTPIGYPATQIGAQVYGGGVNLNLNRIEPVTASRALVNTGVRKFYLAYAATQRSDKVSGLTHSLGLRFEF